MDDRDKFTSGPQHVPTNVVLEERLNHSETNLRDSISKVPSALTSTKESHIRGIIKSLKLNSQSIVTDSLALSDCKTQTGHIQEAEELNSIRFSILNRDSYDTVKFLKN